MLLKYIPRLVGCLFLYAGIYKLLYPGQATLGLFSLGVTYQVATLLVTAVIVSELYLGVVLISHIDLKYAISVSMGVMLVFTAYMCYLSSLASPPSCGCLGVTGIFKSNKEAALFGMFQNCVVLWLLKLAYDYYSEKDLASGRPQQGAASGAAS
jgi:uncharacterized membrane protein YphA (DoxX/SURF4 family)